MTETARDYITLLATGRNKEDLALIRAIEEAIKSRLGRIEGYQVMRMDSAEHIEEELRDSEFFLEASGGRLPFILVNITYVTGDVDPALVAELETRFDLRLVAEQVSEGP